MVEAAAVPVPEAAGPHLQGGRVQPLLSQGEILCRHPSWAGDALEQSCLLAPLGKDGVAKGLASLAGLMGRQIIPPRVAGSISMVGDMDPNSAVPCRTVMQAWLRAALWGEPWGSDSTPNLLLLQPRLPSASEATGCRARSRGRSPALLNTPVASPQASHAGSREPLCLFVDSGSCPELWLSSECA